jgi:hypothetical protein
MCQKTSSDLEKECELVLGTSLSSGLLDVGPSLEYKI